MSSMYTYTHKYADRDITGQKTLKKFARVFKVVISGWEE